MDSSTLSVSTPLPSVRLVLSGHVTIVPGKIHNATWLNGSDWLDVTEGEVTCLTDLHLCRHGLLISSWIKLLNCSDRMYLMSSARRTACTGQSEFSILPSMEMYC